MLANPGCIFRKLIRERKEGRILFAVFRICLGVERPAVVATLGVSHYPQKATLQPSAESGLSNNNGIDEPLLGLDDSWQFLLQTKQIWNESVGFDEPTKGTTRLISCCKSSAHK